MAQTPEYDRTKRYRGGGLKHDNVVEGTFAYTTNFFAYLRTDDGDLIPCRRNLELIDEAELPPTETSN